MIGGLLLQLSAAPLEAAGTAWYVAPQGSDSNPGTLEAPFRTIQRCADVAQPGDTCFIREGTYRETVVVPRSGQAGAPITFKPYLEETVTISGADVLGPNWTLHHGKIYKTAMPWSVNIRQSGPVDIVANDQIFLDGQMMVEARWPNIPVEKVTRLTNAENARADGATVHGSSEATYHDAALGVFPPDFWKGAKINFAPGYGTMHTTCDVTGSTESSVSFQCNPDPGAIGVRTEWESETHRPSTGDYYSLWGKLEALDAPGEWFRTSDGTLYLWAPDGSNPASHTVEARRRLWAFDIRGRSYITIEGLRLFAATIRTDETTHNTVITGITGHYLWHFQEIPALFWADGTRAIEFRGNNNVLRDSDLAYSAGKMVLLDGHNNQAFNNVIRDAAYIGHAPVVGGGNNPGGDVKNEVRQNTIFNGGNILVSASPGLDITYNDLYNSHLQISDLGVIYAWATDGKGSEIAYNLVHDNHAEIDLTVNYFGGHGIYLDDDTYNFKVYRNVVWATSAAGIFTYGTNGARMPDPQPDPATPSNRKIYNNTVDGELSADAKSSAGGRPQTLAGTEFKNNIATVIRLDDPSLTTAANYQGDALYVDRAGRDYRLRPDSPAVDAGQNLGSPYMDAPMSPVGAPDIGAYEQGRPAFVAGALLRQSDLASLTVHCDPDLDVGLATCTVSGLPLGRKAPNDFQLRIGDASPAQNCLTRMDYTAHVGQVICERVEIGSQEGVKPISVRLGSGAWVTTSSSVDLRPLAIFSISPRTGLSGGSTRVTITGRQFDPAPVGYRRVITLENPSSETLYNYQVLVTLDTGTAISQGKLRPNCGDLRFHDAYGTLAYWIEEGCNTPQTRVWVKVPALPPGESQIELTYGNSLLPPASNGAETFIFFDDFEDGVIGPGWDVPNDVSGVTFTETSGTMRIAGRPNESNDNVLFSFALARGAIIYPPSFAIDSELSVVAPSSSEDFKANVGGFEETLTLFGEPSGNPAGKKIGYYTGGWQTLGTSSVNAPTFTKQKFSLGFTGDERNRTVRWMENGDLATPRATRSGLDSPGFGYFGYGPDRVADFEARFDNVRVRNYTFPEPVATVGPETPSGLRVTFGGKPCTAVEVIDTTTLTCLTPANPEGTVDVTVTNPDGASDTLAGGFTYIGGRSLFLPIVTR